MPMTARAPEAPARACAPASTASARSASASPTASSGSSAEQVARRDAQQLEPLASAPGTRRRTRRCPPGCRARRGRRARPGRPRTGRPSELLAAATVTSASPRALGSPPVVKRSTTSGVVGDHASQQRRHGFGCADCVRRGRRAPVASSSRPPPVASGAGDRPGCRVCPQTQHARPRTHDVPVGFGRAPPACGVVPTRHRRRRGRRQRRRGSSSCLARAEAEGADLAAFPELASPAIPPRTCC